MNGNYVGSGYSGNGLGLNNPDKENVANVGPIPRGTWSIGSAFTHPSKGPIVMRLTPAGANAFGRSGFLIHGDNPRLDNSASEGCIVLSRSLRERVRDSGDTTLIVE